jgi:hypothetical protein
MNQSNKPLQGPRENVLTSSHNILGFKRKLNLWKSHTVEGNLGMFPLLLGLESDEGYQRVSSLVQNDHEELRNVIKHHYTSLSTQVYVWVRSPYSESSAQRENFVRCGLIIHSR